MKSFVAAMLAALLLIGGSVGYGMYVQKTAKQLNERTERICTAVENGDFDSAIAAAKALGAEIDSKKEILGAIVDHKEIYEIVRILDEMICYLEEEELADSRAHCAAIAAITDRISENSLPLLFNVL